MISEVSKKVLAGMDTCQARQRGNRVSSMTTSVYRHIPCSPVGILTNLWLDFSVEWAWRMRSGPSYICLDFNKFVWTLTMEFLVQPALERLQ